jgi:lipopolysaccharide export LptBFGC system permease protein LptF
LLSCAKASAPSRNEQTQITLIVRLDSKIMRTVLIIILILLLIGAFPSWPYSTGRGYYPVGGIGLILLIVVILALLGRL